MAEKAVTNITSTPRESQFELLRLVAMLLVLVVHADYYSLGAPTTECALSETFSAFMRVTVESFALVCVNVYILISGYFGIKLRLKSVLSLLFMILFWRLLMSTCAYFAQIEPVTIKQALKYSIPAYHDWFVTSYLILMAVTPLLNKFTTRSTTRNLWLTAGVYAIFQWLFSWGFDIIPWFSRGYSVLSFINLYLIGAALRRTSPPVSHPLGWYVAISLTAAIVMFAIIYQSLTTPRSTTMYEAYNSPNAMLASVVFFLIFARMKFVNRLINRFAGSAFAVYLIHMHPLIKPIYKDCCLYLYTGYSLVTYLLLITAFILAVFVTAIAIDQIRRALWLKISSRL